MIDRTHRDEEPEEYGPIRANEKTWRERIIGAAFGVAAAVLFGFFGALSRGETPRDAGQEALDAARDQIERELGTIVRDELRRQGVATAEHEPSPVITEQAEMIAQLQADLLQSAQLVAEKEEDRREAWTLRDAADARTNEVSNELAVTKARLAEMEIANEDRQCFARDQLAVELRRLCVAQ